MLPAMFGGFPSLERELSAASQYVLSGAKAGGNADTQVSTVIVNLIFPVFVRNIQHFLWL